MARRKRAAGLIRRGLAKRHAGGSSGTKQGALPLMIPPEQTAAALVRAQDLAAAGEFDAARVICHAIFARDPGVVGALQTYVSVTRIAADDPVLARLRAYAGATGLDDGLRSQVQFMLGKGLDDLGDHKGAFAAFRQANDLKPGTFNSAGQEALVDAVLAALHDLPDVALPPVAPRMVFVFGMPRSGTSLTAQMLGAHSGIASLGEVTALGAAVQAGGPLVAQMRALTVERLAQIRAAYLAAILGQGAGAAVLVDKMPENYWFGWLIPMLFPDAVIVHLHRHPLATCWSCYRNDFGVGHGYATDFDVLAGQYLRYRRLVAAGRTRAGAGWVDIALDDLVASPKAVLTPVLARLGLVWEAGMARPDAAGGAVRTLSKWQARQGIDPAIAGGWRAYLPYMEQAWPGAVARLRGCVPI